jgi:hypothetical protein
VQALAAAMQVPPTQQPVVQPLLAQHGPPLAPHAATAPALQTMPVETFCPDGTQVPPLQHPPPPQTMPGQQASFGPPQAAQVPLVQEPPVVHIELAATHRSLIGSQQPPPVQVEPAQHGSLVPPHGSHIPFCPQASPAVVQVPPGQHACEMPPQAMHRPAPAPPQIRPFEQVRFGQQVWLLPPHGTQSVPLQVRPLAVQTLPVQHIWLGPPQVPQLPFAQAPPRPGHMLVAPTQKLFTQQPPPLQVSSAQHAWVAAPHGVHRPVPPPVQTSVASHARPGQQAWPPPPHA